MSWLLSLSLAAATASAPSAMRPIACEGAGLPSDAECVRIAVPENRAAPRRRMIELNVVRLPATGVRGQNAIFVFQGGPGQAASRLADFYARVYRAARATHDIVLIDQRGTGGSNALACDFGGSPARPQRYLADLFEPETIAACRRSLRGMADLAQYTTAAAVQDAEAVRSVLGYPAIDLYGTSYGTRVAMEYARRYPAHVRTITLKGVFSPTAVAPSDFAPNVERSIGLMLRDCANDAACAASFPQLAGDLAAVLRRLAAGPVDVRLDGDETVRLSRGLFGAIVRTMLQATSLRAELPSLLHAAARDDFRPFAMRAIELRRAAQSEIATGLMLSVLCAEDQHYLDRSRARRDAAGTVLGTYWLDQLEGACAIWPKASTPADWRRPYRIQAPALIVSGDLDPATPPEAGESVRAFLSSSKHLIAPGGSHSFAGMSGCIDVAMSGFVVSGRLDGADGDCAAGIRPPPFKTTE